MRTGRLSPPWSPSPRYPRLNRRHEAHRAAKAVILELIADAWDLVLHSLHCTDRCPLGRSSPWPHLNLGTIALPSLPYQRDGRFDGHPGNDG